MEPHLKLIGGVLLLLAGVHVVFPRYFNWKNELASLSLINRQMMQTHTFFIAFTVAMMGALSWWCADDLISTPFGRKISGGLAMFWTVRAFFQFFIYSPKLWRGKLFETLVHVVFSVFWMYMAIVYSLVATNFFEY